MVHGGGGRWREFPMINFANGAVHHLSTPAVEKHPTNIISYHVYGLFSSTLSLSRSSWEVCV